jgi:NAD(P)-dependent dehydrogenase (short-subunit alcohol dehydrogenase family)
MKNPLTSDGKRVLVTGAGTGIGRAIALEFARAGAHVALHYCHDATGAATAVDEICQRGGQAKAFKADFNSVEEARKLADDAIAFLGGLDVLINNAGITMNRPFEQVTPAQFDTLYHVNVRAQFFVAQAALPALLQRGGGVIINISSIHAFEGYAQHSVYAGTKGAIVAMTRELAIELAPRGIRVNCIAPGAIEVANYYKAMPDFDPKAAGQLIPAGFIGQPIDIARAAVWLASDEARFIVGQTLVIDGGTTAWMPFSDAFRQQSTAQFGKGYVPGI